MEASGAGRPVVFATLPEEPHSLGLEMAALSVVTAGRAVRMLGAQLPPEEIVEAAGVMDASAVALSVSIYSVDDNTRKLVAGLRDRLGERIELWVGGGGASELENLPEGVTVLKTLDELDETVRQLQS